MKKINKYSLAIVATLLVNPSTYAAMMSTDAQIFGAINYTNSNSQQTGTVQSMVSIPGGNPDYYSHALSSDTGKTAAAVRIDYSQQYGSGGLGGGPHTNTANATWSNTFTGNGSRQVLNFHIDQGMLQTNSSNHEGLMRAGYGINISLNGNSIWSSHDEIGWSPNVPNGQTLFFNDYDDNRLSHRSPAPWEDGGSTDPFLMEYNLYDPFTGQLDLGTFAEGETFEITYEMGVYSYSDFWIDGYALAHFGDPLNLSGGEGGISASVSPVPVPAAVYLFGSGLIGLLGFSSRRKNNVEKTEILK